tara:strand:- start:190 stop:651 length:462 start_codon:yes stop_codon:yes gene_type:complete
MKITNKNRLFLIIFFLMALLIVNNYGVAENFKDNLDNIDGMDKKMDEMNDIEKETRMFCKILRHDEDKVQLKDLLNERNQQFQDNWQKQNKTINDIKNKFIKLRLEKDGRNLVEYNDNRNNKKEQMVKRNKVLKKAKEIAESPYNLNVNINNS